MRKMFIDFLSSSKKRGLIIMKRLEQTDLIKFKGKSKGNRMKYNLQYPVGRLSTKLISILSLLPPSEARPACISTAMASATCLSFPIGVPHFSSNSFRMAIARAHLPEFFTRWRTTSAAAAQTAPAHTAAVPTATFPIWQLTETPQILIQ